MDSEARLMVQGGELKVVTWTCCTNNAMRWVIEEGSRKNKAAHRSGFVKPDLWCKVGS